MTKPQNFSAAPVFKKVTASPNNENDKNYYHCFEQDERYTLTFDVEIGSPSVNNIYFVLWNLNDPVNPVMAEPPTDWHVEKGHAKIEIAPTIFISAPVPTVPR